MKPGLTPFPSGRFGLLLWGRVIDWRGGGGDDPGERSAAVVGGVAVDGVGGRGQGVRFRLTAAEAEAAALAAVKIRR